MNRSAVALLDRATQPVPARRYLSIFRPAWSPELRGTIEAITRLTPTSVAIDLRPNHRWPGHRSGQFVGVGVEVDGVLHHRTYSLTSAPTDSSGGRRGLIQIAVQRVDGGLVSTHLTSDAQVGDVVRLTPPAGEFVMSDAAHTASAGLLFVTGGSGVTPIIGMLRDLEACRRGGLPATRVRLIHHSRDGRSTMFAEELGRLDEANPWLEVTVVHSGTHLTSERLDELCPDWAQREVFACGPSSLLEAVEAACAAAGAAERLHLERFVPVRRSVTADPAHPTVAHEATFARSSVTVAPLAGETLLETAERSGILARSGCRTGICHTCTTRIVSGCATEIGGNAVHDAGAHVRICVTRSADDIVLDL